MSALEIQANDLCLADCCIPGLVSGMWTLKIEQHIKAEYEVNTTAIVAEGRFFVSSPQFSIDAQMIVNRYPPDKSAGAFGNTLPHIVLQNPVLPWARAMGRSDAPWMALLLLDEDELARCAREQINVKQFLAGRSGVYQPSLIKQQNISGDDACETITIPVDIFRRVSPHLDELPYLAHCRHVPVENKANPAGAGDGWFGVVLSNRFPAADARVSTAVLVSLEGLESVLKPDGDFAGCESVRLILLASFSFQAGQDQRGGFAETAKAFCRPGSAAMLRLETTLPQQADESARYAQRRLEEGFIPLRYRARTGEGGFGWYRGLFSPVITQWTARETAYESADAALVYDAAYGVFDFSLASAFETGRMAAFADPYASGLLLKMRSKAQYVADAFYSMKKRGYSESGGSYGGGLSTYFYTAMSGSLLENLSDPIALSAFPEEDAPPLEAEEEVITSVDALEARITDDVLQTLDGDISGLAQWLADLVLGKMAQPETLLPDKRLLPRESVRYFYLDANFMEAMVDGVLSLGLASSRQTVVQRVLRRVLLARISAAVPMDTPLSGLLLHSSLIANWPTLDLIARDGRGSALSILRISRLGPAILLCILRGVPEVIELREPPEGTSHGLNGQGFLHIRRVVHTQSGVAFQEDPEALSLQIRGNDTFFREDGRVLRLSPDAPDALAQSLAKAATGDARDPCFRPAMFALQLLRVPQAVHLTAKYKQA